MSGEAKDGRGGPPAPAGARTGTSVTGGATALAVPGVAWKALPSGLGPLLSDLPELKRVRCRGWPGESLADAAFRRAVADLSAGADADAVAIAHLALAAAHTRLGSVDETALADAAVPAGERRIVYRRAAADALGPLSEAEADTLDALSATPGAPAALAPGLARLAETRWRETHADEPDDRTTAAIRFGEHAYAVAVIGAAIARARGEAPGGPFLLGLLHHAADLGLPPAHELGLPPQTAAMATDLLAARDDLSAPASLAFNAADGVDAVAERRAALNHAGLSLTDALPADEIAPPGPLRAFHVAVLRALGLAY